MSTNDFTKTHPVPGFGEPLDYTPEEDDPLYINTPLRSALSRTDLDDGRIKLPLTTLREFTMLQLMNTITDKPEWYKKVFDDDIAQKWKAEALSAPDRDVTEKMINWCLEELKQKAAYYSQTPSGAIKVYNGDVLKSDIAVSVETKEALQKAVQPLEDVPDRLKDWHPGSDGKVLDIVHPSLFPLVYGKSKILPIGANVTTLEDCVKRCGEGDVIPVLQANQRTDFYSRPRFDPFSDKFQWLPCEVDISGDKTKIITYINNLHPQKHLRLYHVIEDVITAALPLWDFTLAPLIAKHFSHSQRITYTGCEYDPDPERGPETEGPQQLPNEDQNQFWERRDQWCQATRRVVLPEPDDFITPEMPPRFSLKDTCGAIGRPLQIIVKLANIELTPEKPEYEGGTWHVEGKLNEHICATALYYYSCANISTSSLAFRQVSDDEETIDIGYEQDHHDWLPAVFGCEQDGPAVQIVGSVETREGRLITFPNILQHQVQPFKLADPTRPGHRKILALFLVDPNSRVISTANLPCQQLDWWQEEVQRSTRARKVSGKPGLGELPAELQDEVFSGVDGFPISLEVAKELRLELMEERKKFAIDHGQRFESTQFSLCEH